MQQWSGIKDKKRRSLDKKKNELYCDDIKYKQDWCVIKNEEHRIVKKNK